MLKAGRHLLDILVVVTVEKCVSTMYSLWVTKMQNTFVLAKETYFSNLYLGSLSFAHEPHVTTRGEGCIMGGSVNHNTHY